MKRIAAAGLLTVTVFAAFGIGRRSCRRSGPRTADCDVRVAESCFATTADAAGLLDESLCGERLREQWGHLHTRLVDLERRATGLAAATPHGESVPAFDRLAGALISLRTALETDVSLRLDREPEPRVVDAAADIVVVRCEDVNVAARALAGSRA